MHCKTNVGACIVWKILKLNTVEVYVPLSNIIFNASVKNNSLLIVYVQRTHLIIFYLKTII